MKYLLLALLFIAALASCARKPAYLTDDMLVPPGSRVSFWVLHDKHGWVESNIHIISVPRTMTGAEVRLWADGVGRHDADMNWTAFYALVTLPGQKCATLRSPVTPHIGRY